jgi:hypothetical protein
MQVLTRSHRSLDLTTITAEQIQKIDLRAVVDIGRFAAQTAKFWSVAQHSMNVARVTSNLGGSANAQAWALLHDAHEAYFGDVIRPLVDFLGQKAGDAIDGLRRRIDAAIAERFELTLDAETLTVVQQADDIVLAAEIIAFFPADTKTLLTIPAVARHWPLIQYVTIEAVNPKLWVDQVDALWPVSLTSPQSETPVGAA